MPDLYKKLRRTKAGNIMDIIQLLKYHEQVRKRTLRLIECIPHDHIEWRYDETKFSVGDLVRHIATTERYIFAESVQLKLPRYPGCGKEMAEGFENILVFFNSLHKESMDIFSRLSNNDLDKKCPTPAGSQIGMGKWLMLMSEHEIHHRGQLYVYLGLLGIKVPPLYGVTSEEALERSRA